MGVIMSRILKTIFTFCLVIALQTSRASYLEKARKVVTPITHFNKEELVFDYSSIKLFGTIKHLALLYEPNKNFPIIARYTLSNGKELWFLLDYHYNPSCTAFANHVITNENFTHGIIENEMIVSALLHNNPYLNFTETFSMTLPKQSKEIHNNTMGKVYRLLQEQNKIIVPGEFHTPQETLTAYQKEKLTPEHIICALLVLSKNYCPLPNNIKPLLNNASVKHFLQSQNDFTNTSLINNFISIRDKKIAKTIIDTLHDQKAKKVFIAYGAAHWFTLEKFLEEHFGKPSFFSPESYEHCLKKQNFHNQSIIKTWKPS